jgi:AcrR family transcriptional regulator
MTRTSSLRERQAEQVRESVLDAVLTQLETRAYDDLSMAQIAEAAGISLRTLYRYFPDRDALLHAAGERLYSSLEVPIEIDGAERIAENFRAAARRLSTRPELARALVRSGAGRAARSGLRPRRVEAIRAALAPVTDTLDPETAGWATAVISHLCSVASWVAIADESGLSDADAQQAVAWAIDRLVAALQQPAPSRARRRPPHSPLGEESRP